MANRKKEIVKDRINITFCPLLKKEIKQVLRSKGRKFNLSKFLDEASRNEIKRLKMQLIDYY